MLLIQNNMLCLALKGPYDPIYQGGLAASQHLSIFDICIFFVQYNRKKG